MPSDSVLLLFHRPLLPGYRDASTVWEHINAFGRESAFPVRTLNTDLGFPRALRGFEPGAIILHYSLFGTGTYRLSPRFCEWLDGSDAYKVAFFQDEFYFCVKRFAFLNEHEIDCVFTHVDPQYFDQVYGRYTSVPRLEHNLPGYVSHEMIREAEHWALKDDDRAIDVGYRGRPLPPYMGAGSQEKAAIGDRFAAAAVGAGLALDIDTTEAGRLYKDEWSRFIGGCKSVLGVESGVSLFDLEDEVRKEWETTYAHRSGVTLEQLRQGALSRWDERIPYRTVSPRHFEAAAFRTCQVLFEGRYSGVLEPMRHYIPLRKDFANVDEVIAQVRDPALRRELTDNARRELVDSGDWSYSVLIRRLDAVLGDAGLKPLGTRGGSEAVDRLLARGRRRRRLATGFRWRAITAWHGFFGRINPLTRRVRALIGCPAPGARARR